MLMIDLTYYIFIKKGILDGSMCEWEWRGATFSSKEDNNQDISIRLC